MCIIYCNGIGLISVSTHDNLYWELFYNIRNTHVTSLYKKLYVDTKHVNDVQEIPWVRLWWRFHWASLPVVCTTAETQYMS